LVSLRIGLLWGTQLLLFFFLRVVGKSVYVFPMSVLLSINGALMAVYGLMQKFGCDFLSWPGSPFNVVGTFGNPNFFGAYIMVTALLTLGIFRNGIFSSLLPKVFFGLIFILHLFALNAAGSKSAWLGLSVGIILLYSKFWEIRAGKFFRRSSFRGAALLALALVVFYGLADMAMARYPWESVSTPPFEYFEVISRLFIWKMGFSLSIGHFFSGLGPGGSQFLLAGFRPPFGTFFALSFFNDDPHSFALLLLGETGIFGLWGACALLIAAWGVHSRFRNKHYAVEADNNAICRSAIAPGQMAKGLAAAAISLLFHGLFNNSLTALPLSNLLLLLAALHQSACLRDVRWKRSFSFTALIYLVFPLIFAASAWILQSNHHEVERNLFEGFRLIESNKPTEAAISFEKAVRANPQSMQSLLGLAKSLELQGRLGRTQDILLRLEGLGPNVGNVRFHLANLLFERNLILEAHRYALLSLAGNQTPAAYELLGRILGIEGRLEESEQILREGINVPFREKIDWNAVNSMRLQLSSIAVGKGDFLGAKNQLASLSMPFWDSAEAHFLRGMIEYKLENATEALRHFETALARNATEPKYLNAAGYLLVQTSGDLNRARTLLEDAYKGYRLRPAPTLSDILSVAHSLGMLYWKLGLLDKAQELLTMAFLQCPLEWKDVRETRAKDLKTFLFETNRQGPEELNQ